MFDQNITIFKLRYHIFTGGQLYVGNGFCDDGLNTAECNFDAGDCCKTGANTDHCVICQCLSGQNGTTTNPGNTGLSFSSFFTGNNTECNFFFSVLCDFLPYFVPICISKVYFLTRSCIKRYTMTHMKRYCIINGYFNLLFLFFLSMHFAQRCEFLLIGGDFTEQSQCRMHIGEIRKESNIWTFYVHYATL